jgi:hypothetical protein
MAKEQEVENVETEAAEEAQEAGTQAEERPRTVPHAALHEERVRRQETERALKQANEKFAMLEGRLEELRRAAEPKQEAGPADPIKDIEEIKAWKKNTEQALAQQQQQEQGFNDFNNAVTSQIDEFRGENPDYDAAIEFLSAARDRQLKRIGHTAPEALSIMKREANAIFAKALQDGVNPGSRVYALAEEMGFKPGAAEEKPNGSATASQRLRTIAAGQGAARSLSNAAGSATKPLTLQALADMPRDEFRKIAGDPKAWRKLMTGQG